MNYGFITFYICFIVTKEQILIFFAEEKRLQKESLSQNKKHHMLLPNQNYNTTNNLLLGFQNILCYYQTQSADTALKLFAYFKTSYVITKLQLAFYGIFRIGFQNILCYYQTNCSPVPTLAVL